MGGLIPLSDASRRPVRMPVITPFIILVNALVFLLELTRGDAFVMAWSAIPAQIVSGHHGITILTAMFMHGSWSHIIGNMIFLWAFGPEIEDAMGPVRYLIFYLLGGLVAMLAQVAASPHSTVPNLGASGAIAAVMGAFIVTYPRDQIKAVLFIFIFCAHHLDPGRALDRFLVSYAAHTHRRRRASTNWRCGLPRTRGRVHLRSSHRPSLRKPTSPGIAATPGLNTPRISRFRTERELRIPG